MFSHQPFLETVLVYAKKGVTDSESYSYDYPFKAINHFTSVFEELNKQVRRKKIVTNTFKRSASDERIKPLLCQISRREVTAFNSCLKIISA